MTKMFPRERVILTHPHGRNRFVPHSNSINLVMPKCFNGAKMPRF